MAAATPWPRGTSRILDALVEEQGARALSDPVIEIGYRLIFATIMLLESGDADVAGRIDGGITQGAGLIMRDYIIKKAGKAAKLRRRTHKANK